MRFFFGGLGFAPKEAKPIAAAMSSGGEGGRQGMGGGSGMLVVDLGLLIEQRKEGWKRREEWRCTTRGRGMVDAGILVVSVVPEVSC